MLVIYFGRDLTEGFTLILAVKMKVHKLLYFYWSLLTHRGHQRRERGLNDHRFHGRAKGKGRSRKYGSSDFTVDRLIDFRERKRAAPSFDVHRGIFTYSEQKSLSFFHPLDEYSILKSANESLIFYVEL